jgi:hypothetical protein
VPLHHNRSSSYHHHQHRRSRSRSRSRGGGGGRGAGGQRRRSPDYQLGAAHQPEEGELDGDEEQGGGYQQHHGGRRGGDREAGGGGRSRAPPRGGGRRPERPNQPTLFVGDLPPSGFSSADLQGLFAAYGWDVTDARVHSNQCYGFVEFRSQAEAEQALFLVQSRDPGFAIDGQSIRASWAKGSMPTWKRGGVEGPPVEAYPHHHPHPVVLAPGWPVLALPAVPQPQALPFGLGLPVQQQSRAAIDYGDL